MQRLNAITMQLAELDFAAAPIFIINGLKREELIATNSMVLHELFFASLGDGGEPDGALYDAPTRDFGSVAYGRSPLCWRHAAGRAVIMVSGVRSSCAALAVNRR